MNIAFFAPYFHPYISGMTTYPLAVFTALAKKHAVNVLTFAHKKDLPKHELFAGIHISRMSFLARVSKGFLSPSSLFTFAKTVATSDVIVVNLPSVEGLPLVLLARLCNKPVLAFFYCEVILRNSVLERVAEWVLNAVTKLQLNVSQKIVGLSFDYIDSLGWSQQLRAKVTIVPPPVAQLAVDAVFAKKLSSKKKNAVWVGFAGRVSREKGLAVLAQALPLLQTNKKTVFVCAGPYGKDVAGELEYFEQLTQELKTHKIEFEFLGSLSGGKLGAFYKNIDVLVLPSINKTEAMGMVQLEAMLLGTPVVVSNLPGVRQPVLRTKMGEIAAIGDARDLAANITKVLAATQKYCSRGNRQTAQRLYGSGKTAELIEQLLLDMTSVS